MIAGQVPRPVRQAGHRKSQQACRASTGKTKKLIKLIVLMVLSSSSSLGSRSVPWLGVGLSMRSENCIVYFFYIKVTSVRHFNLWTF